MGNTESITEGDYEVVCQKWEEKERGWGSRPDGFSLHINHELRRQYIEEYWDSMPDHAPDTYESPDGSPYEVGVSIEVYAELVALGSIRYAAHYPYPGDGGVDGWRAR